MCWYVVGILQLSSRKSRATVFKFCSEEISGWHRHTSMTLNTFCCVTSLCHLPAEAAYLFYKVPCTYKSFSNANSFENCIFQTKFCRQILLIKVHPRVWKNWLILPISQFLHCFLGEHPIPVPETHSGERLFSCKAMKIGKPVFLWSMANSESVILSEENCPSVS